MGNKKGVDVEVVRESLEYIIKYLDEALEILSKKRLTSEDKERVRKLIRRVVRKAHASLIGLVKDREGRTLLVDHLVVGRRGGIRHYGIHGLRGHNPENPDQVQFKNKHGKPVEYEEVGEVRDRKHPARKRVKKTRRVKKAG